MVKPRATLKIRADTIEENESVINDLRAKNEVDDRSLETLHKLFDSLNAKIAKAKKKPVKNTNEPVNFGTSDDDVLYGPLIGSPPGSWWGVMVDCSRSRAHRPLDANVDHGPFGAASVRVTYSDTNRDVDHDNLLTFTGSEYTEDPAKSEPLVMNHLNRVPFRLIRNCSLAHNCAPRTGLLYSGLYIVVTHWLGQSKDSKKHHKFAFLKLANQETPMCRQRIENGDRYRIMTSINKNKTSPYRKVESEKRFSYGCSIGSFNSHARSQHTNIFVRTNLYDSGRDTQDPKKVKISGVIRKTEVPRIEVHEIRVPHEERETRNTIVKEKESGKRRVSLRNAARGKGTKMACNGIEVVAGKNSGEGLEGRRKTVDHGIQCALISKPSIDCAVQTISRIELVDKSAPGSDADEEKKRDWSRAPSAFAAVEIIGNEEKIARLRSIGFRPIRRKSVSKEYSSYMTSSDSVVEYMEEGLNCKDLEAEDVKKFEGKLMKPRVSRKSVRTKPNGPQPVGYKKKARHTLIEKKLYNYDLGRLYF